MGTEHKRTLTELCLDVATAYETEYGQPMNGEGVGYIVAEWLEGFVNTPGDELPEMVRGSLLELAHSAREEGRK